MNNDLDLTDIRILYYLREHGSALKSTIHNESTVEVSVQTVGRRVNDLYEQDLVEQCLLRNPDQRKNFGFTVTEQGLAALDQALDELRICKDCGDVCSRDDLCNYVPLAEVLR